MFDEIPENKAESYPCPECDRGNVTIQNENWECDSCQWWSPVTELVERQE